MSGPHFARIPPRVAAMHDLKGTDLRVLIAIASFADEEGRAFPGMGTIASIAGMRRGDVPRALSRLEAAGIVRRERSSDRTSTNIYTIAFDDERVSARADRGCQHRDVQGVSADTDRVYAPALQGVRARAYQTNNNRPITKRTSRFDMDGARESFERFLAVYPSRGRDPANPSKPALEKFVSAMKRGVDPEVMIRAAGHYAAAMQRQGTAGKFIKTMVVWLNQECWQQYADLDSQPDQPLVAGMI